MAKSIKDILDLKGQKREKIGAIKKVLPNARYEVDIGSRVLKLKSISSSKLQVGESVVVVSTEKGLLVSSNSLQRKGKSRIVSFDG